MPNVEVTGSPVDRRVGLAKHAENDSTALVFAESDVVTLCAKCSDTGLRHARRLARARSCGRQSGATVRRGANGCGGERRGQCHWSRPGLRDFLRLSAAVLCQFCLVQGHGFGGAQRKVNRLARFWASPC